MSDVAGSRTPEEEALAGEIEHTREQLGETVEALAAKADVKGRAQNRATEVKENLRGKARAAKDKVTEQAGELREEAAAKTARAKESAQAGAAQAKQTAQATAAQAKDAAQSAGTPVAGQLAGRAAAAGRAVRDIAPEPVQRSAGQAAVIVRGHRGKAAAAAVAAAALILAWLAVRPRRR
jgi:hypothetical protein